MMKPRKDGFTLIEMLTVMVIIVIVLGIGVPAFTNLMKSGGLTGASREVANALGLARQYAITHRTTTRVVFSYSGTQVPAVDAASTNRCPWFQSYAVVDEKAGTYISKWEHLPMGTVFMDSNNPKIAAPSPLGLSDLLQAGVPFPTNSAPVATVAYIEFRPTGAATPLPGGRPSIFTITEGLVNSGTTVGPVTPTSKTSSNTLANQSIISVDSIIGRIQVTRP